MTKTEKSGATRTTRAKPDNRRSDTRERAIRAAERLLARGGYAALSMDDVARALGIRSPSLYHHFAGGKEQLLLAVAAQRAAEDSAQITALMAAEKDPIARLRAAAAYFATMAGHNARHALAESRRQLSPPARRTLQDQFAEAIEEPLAAVIEEAIASGVFRPSEPIAAVRVFLMLMLSLGEFEADARLRAYLPGFLLDLFIDGMRTPTAAGSGASPAAPRPATRRRPGARSTGD